LKKAGGIAELVTIPGDNHGNCERGQVLRAWTSIEAFLTNNVLSKTRRRVRGAVIEGRIVRDLCARAGRHFLARLCLLSVSPFLY
jgi:hypothetical protein